MSWPASQSAHNISGRGDGPHHGGRRGARGSASTGALRETWDTLAVVGLAGRGMSSTTTRSVLAACATVTVGMALAKLAGPRVSRRMLRARRKTPRLNAFVQEGLTGGRVA